MRHVSGISVPKPAVCEIDPTRICTVCPSNKNGMGLIGVVLLPLLAALGKNVNIPTDDP